jgi:hypothetical protein
MRTIMKAKKAATTLISAEPVKSFFVHMLTRDIDLPDAILDLLDNCVDGIQRIEAKRKVDKKRPYEKYWAKITLLKHEFKIEDNCGGIPWNLRDYAFRMGPAKEGTDKSLRMIGTYGIGMKRAIFKLGRDCTIETHSKDRSYQIRLSPEWMSNDKWNLKAVDIPARPLGTTIRISELLSTVGREFDSEVFRNKFRNAVATHYAYIIEKGFKVFLNGDEIQAKRIDLLFSKDSEISKHPIRPFIYEAKHEDVDIFLAVGFTRGIPSKEEADSSLEEYKEGYSSSDAGWTVICNDRTVLYADKTALTGWGVSGVPQFHMQFIAISGIVIFSSTDPRQLPMTTTKRGLDAQSDLYLHVKDKMIEGMKIFTNYTNVWKGRELVKESRQSFAETGTANVNQLLQETTKLAMSPTRGSIKGKQYKPELPRPDTPKKDERIIFTRPTKEVRAVSRYLFGNPNKSASEVAEKCFSLVLEEALR